MYFGSFTGLGVREGEFIGSGEGVFVGSDVSVGKTEEVSSGSDAAVPGVTLLFEEGFTSCFDGAEAAGSGHGVEDA